MKEAAAAYRDTHRVPPFPLSFVEAAKVPPCKPPQPHISPASNCSMPSLLHLPKTNKTNQTSIPASRLSSIAVVSPHRNDAAFSLGALLSSLTEHAIAITIVNLFTESAFAPLLPGASLQTTTRVHRAEDEAFIRHLGPLCHLHDLGLADAPLRLDIPLEHVTRAPLSPRRFFVQTQSLAAHLAPLDAFDLVLLPLAFGNHIDHCLARDAGRLALPHDRIGFYEDLPCAACLDAPTRAAHERSLHLEHHTAVTLPLPRAASRKAYLASLYTSQIPPDSIAEITAYTSSLGGERLLLTGPITAALLDLLAPAAPQHTLLPQIFATGTALH